MKLPTFVSAAMAVSVLFSMEIVASPEVHAANQVTCYGDYCSGRDAEKTHCADDAITVMHRTDEYASLQVRWSPTCKTNWARLIVYSQGNFGTYPYGLLEAAQDTGYTQNYTVPFTAGDPAIYWTPMIYSPEHRVRATFYGRGWKWDYISTDWA